MTSDRDKSYFVTKILHHIFYLLRPSPVFPAVLSLCVVVEQFLLLPTLFNSPLFSSVLIISPQQYYSQNYCDGKTQTGFSGS